MFSEAIFNMQRPATNALRILAKCQSELYKKEQNMFEKEQQNRISEIVGKNFGLRRILRVNRVLGLEWTCWFMIRRTIIYR